MKKINIFRYVLLIAVILIFIGRSAADTVVYAQQKDSTKVSLRQAEITIYAGQTYRLYIKVSGKNGRPAWTSSKTRVVSVDRNGNIKAKKEGTAKITVSVNGVKRSCMITVKRSLDIRDYLMEGAGSEGTVAEMKKLAKDVGKMKAGNKKKYPDVYYSGNQMVIGVNDHPVYGTKNDEYIRIENNGNKQVLFYGVKIGCTKQQLEKNLKITTS